MEAALGWTFIIAFGSLIWATLTDRRETAVVIARLSLLGLISLFSMALMGWVIGRYTLGWDWPVVLTAAAVLWVIWARRYHVGLVRLFLQGASGIAVAAALVLVFALINPSPKPIILNGEELTLLRENKVDVAKSVQHLNVKVETSGENQLLLLHLEKRELVPVTWDGNRALTDFDTLLKALHKLYGTVEGDPGYFQHRIYVWG